MQILDFYGDPTYVSEFHSSLFAAGYAAGPGTAAGVPDLFSMWNAYANKGIVHKDTSWAGNNVPGQLEASGLSEERFRGSGEKGSYAALPGLSMHLALRNKVSGCRGEKDPAAAGSKQHHCVLQSTVAAQAQQHLPAVHLLFLLPPMS
jgi:hypothetical protein